MINKHNTHIIPIDFTYHSPVTLEAAFRLLNKHRGEAKLFAGGTDLIPQLKMRRLELSHIINLKKIPGLTGIWENQGILHVGALTTLRALERAALVQENVPLITETVKAMASVQVRNMGTIGGNLCNASPAADLSVTLIALGAKVWIAGPRGRRSVDVEEFFTGPGKTVMEHNEILTEITVPVMAEGSGCSFIKIGRVVLDLATVNAAVKLSLTDGTISDCRVAIGAVGPTPLRLRNVEDLLKGKRPGFDVYEAAGNLTRETVEPIKDVRSTAEYRRAVSKTIIMDTLDRATRRAGG